MIEQVIHHNSTLAIIIRSNHRQSGIEFFTPDDFSQQLGYMNRPKGHTIAPHYHQHIERSIIHTQEVLVIKSGKLKVNFYNINGEYLESRILHKGDVILLASGAHGFEMLEETEIIEIKQGPYLGEMDKVHLDG